MSRITELFILMRMHEQLTGVMGTVRALALQDVQEANDNLPDDPEAMMGFDMFVERALNICPIEEMMEDMTIIYNRHFSDSDIEDFLAFYGSPAGQHFLDAQPAIMQEYQPVILERVKVRKAKLKKEIDEFFETLDKKEKQ